MNLFSLKVCFRERSLSFYAFLCLFVVLHGDLSAGVYSNSGSLLLTFVSSFSFFMFHEILVFKKKLFVNVETFLFNPLPLFKKFKAFVFYHFLGSRCVLFLVSFLAFIISGFMKGSINVSMISTFFLSYFFYISFMIIPFIFIPRSVLFFQTLSMFVVPSYLVYMLTQRDFSFPWYLYVDAPFFFASIVLLVFLLFFGSWLWFKARYHDILK